MPERGDGPLTALAFDFGLKRIGIAVGDTLTCTAAPRTTLAVPAGGPDWAAIARHVLEIRPDLLVVGTPYNADGSPSELTAHARRFAAELERRFGLPVASVDERWSSLEAGRSLAAQRLSGARRRRVRRGDVDSAAAAVILERWLAGEREKR